MTLWSYQGYYSDPPDVSFYAPKQRNGQLLKDALGLQLFECSRGTSAVELWHKHIHDCLRSFKLGLENATTMLAELCYRYNQNISKNKRAGYPDIGETLVFNTFNKCL